LADDLGFSDLGCYGGEIHTPHLDRLAPRGVRFTHAYNGTLGMPGIRHSAIAANPAATSIGRNLTDIVFTPHKADQNSVSANQPA